MDSNNIKDVENTAKANYQNSELWSDDDVWHSYTYKILHGHIQKYLDELQLKNTKIVLNAGCGKTTYQTCAIMIHMDIIEEYIHLFENYLVGSIEKIPCRIVR